MNEWIETTIGEYCPFIYGKSLSESKRQKGNIPVYGSNGIVGFHDKSLVEYPGIIIGRKGSVGAIHLSEEPFWAIDTSFYIYSTNLDELYFIYFLLKTLGLDKMNSDSAVPGLNRENAHSLKIRIPKQLIEREKIGKKLAIFDHKIHLNTKTNQTLEAIAQALYKSWFIDFEPVKAKQQTLAVGGSAAEAERAAMRAISGKDDAALDALQLNDSAAYQQLQQTAALFPAALQDSELGEIPEGWEVSTIGESLETVGGATPSTKDETFWQNGNINWATPKDLSALQDFVLTDTERKITNSGLNKISSGLLPINTVLLSSRAPVGYLALTQIPVAINQGFIAIKPNKMFSSYYILQWCKANLGKIKNRAIGTTFAEISKSNFRGIKILVPSGAVTNLFSEKAEVIYKKITNNILENKKLQNIRDELLPKLLSGELTL